MNQFTMKHFFKGFVLFMAIALLTACSSASASSITEKHPPTVDVKKQAETILITPGISSESFTIVPNDYHQVSIVSADNPSDYFAVTLAHRDMIIAPKSTKAFSAHSPSPQRDRYWCSIINIRFQKPSLASRINLPNRSHPLMC